MSVDRTIDVLRHANGYRAVQRWLNDQGLRSGASWEQIQASIEEHVADKKLTQQDLHDFVVDLHSRANKLVSLYRVTKKNHGVLWEMAKTFEGEDHNDVGFPWLLPKSELEELDEEPELVYTRKTADGYELFFTSVRLGHDMAEIPIEEIVATARDKYRDSRMTVERVVRRQAFDVVFIPDDSQIIQIRVDTGNMAAKDRDGARSYLEQVILSSSKIGGTNFAAINLFPAVRSIYDDAGEGLVTGIHFNYGTGTLTHRMHRTAAGLEDLRKDPFHTGGVNKVNKKNVLVFWLSVKLEDDSLKNPESIEVTLPGAVRHLNGAQLLAFEVNGFASEAAIAYAVEVIRTHVDKAAS